MFRYKVRRALRDQQGYECQEADADFMLAFTSPADAVRFCLSVMPLLPCLVIDLVVKSILQLLLLPFR